jgi:hypothetical protein
VTVQCKLAYFAFRRSISRYCAHRVTALSWDPIGEVLYIGGDFDSIDSNPISSGLSMWTSKLGLRGLPCLESADGECNGPEGSAAGIRESSQGPSGIVVALAFDSQSQVRSPANLNPCFTYICFIPTVLIRCWRLSSCQRINMQYNRSLEQVCRISYVVQCKFMS